MGVNGGRAGRGGSCTSGSEGGARTSRVVVGWQAFRSPRTDLALDALKWGCGAAGPDGSTARTKAQLIRHEEPTQGLDDVELATLGYVDWFNHPRLRRVWGWCPQPSLKLATMTAPRRRR